MRDTVRRRFGQVERALRPGATAALRQADALARQADAVEAINQGIAAVEQRLDEQSLRLDRLEAAVLGGADAGPPGNDDYDLQTELVMQRVLRPTDTCLDVGANEGLILERILRLAPEGHHHAFEPIPAMAAGLRERFPSVEVHEVALAAEAGESSFHHVTSNPSYSGLLERRYDRPEETVELITVRTARLDDEVPGDLDVRLVKIDVEGGEEGVFRGGLATLARCRPYVVFEHGLGAADRYGSRPETVYGLLRDLDLEVTLLARWLAGDASLSADQFVDEFESARNYYFLAHPAG